MKTAATNAGAMKAAAHWLRPQTAAMTSLLGQFVRSESPSNDKKAVDRFGQIVTAQWKQRGAKTVCLRQKDRGDHLRVEWNFTAARGDSQLLVLGHLDTVYELGTIARTPFRIARGRAWGPGTFDMKGGLVLALFAVDALLAAKIFPEKRIVFLWTSDEEIGSDCSRAVIEREAKRSSAVLVLEPALGPAGALKTGRKGVGEFELAVTGKSAHAGLNPEDGINAIAELAQQLIRVSRWNQPRRGITVNAGIVEGGTRTNVIPAHARALIDVRASRVQDMRALEQRFRELRPMLPGAKLEISGGFNRPPMERKMCSALFARARAIGNEAGLALDEGFAGGGSDGNFTAALGVPTLDGLGAVGENAHSPRENVLIRSLPERAALLAGLLARL